MMKEQIDQALASYELKHGSSPNALVLGYKAYEALKVELGIPSDDVLNCYRSLRLVDPRVMNDLWHVSVTRSNQI